MSSSAQKVAAALLLAAGWMSVSSAQTAYRCDNNGQTVYSDKPCPAGKTVVGTQDSAEQKAASKDANAQMRKDNADLNKVGDGRRVIGKFGSGSATMTVTNQRGGIGFFAR